MGKNREHNAKVLLNSLVGLSSSNKKKANDIINLYKDNIVGTYRQAQNLINKLSSRGKGQQKVKETVKQIKKSKMISSIDRRNFDKPLSYSFLTLNTRERNLKEIQHDIFPIVENEVKDMLETKKSMKLNVIIHFEICVEKRFKNEKEQKKFESQLTYPDRLGELEEDYGSKTQVLIKRSKPYSTEAKDVKHSNIETVLTAKFDNLDNKLARLVKAQGSEWQPYKFHKIDIKGFTAKAERGSSYIETPEKCSNAKCGLINIQNDDNECFKWCVKYHQSKKEKHCDRISVLKKVEDKYNYEGISYPATFERYSNV